MATDAVLEFHHLNSRVPGVQAVYAYAATESTPSEDRSPHRGLPSPSLNLIVTADEPLLCSESASDWAARRGRTHDVCVGAFHTQPVYLQRPDRQEGVQIEVHPLAARRLFGLPVSALTELTQDGDGVVGPRIRWLHARVGSTGDAVERARLVDRELAGLAAAGDDAPAPRPEVVGTWELLRRSSGRMRIAEVAERVAVTPRHLGTLVHAELGLSPKQLGKLFRFDAARRRIVDELNRHRTPHLSGIAADCGFADHSHLVRSYRAHAHTTPTGWIDEEFRNIQSGGHRPVPPSIT